MLGWPGPNYTKHKYYAWARVNQQSLMHQFCPLEGLRFFIGAWWGSSQSISFCCWSLYLFSYFLVLHRFSSGPDLTHNYLAHFFTLISIAPTLIHYLLSPIDTATLITNYLIDLAIVLTTDPTNLATLLITYLTNVTTILTTYPIDRTTLRT
jgi:hypothetical protein